MTLQSLLSRTVAIETYSTTGGASHGQRTKTWATLVDPAGTVSYATIPARIQPLSASDKAKYYRDSMQVSHRVYLGSPGMSAAQLQTMAKQITQRERVNFTNAGVTRYFLIQAVRNLDELQRLIVLDCLETKA